MFTSISFNSVEEFHNAVTEIVAVDWANIAIRRGDNYNILECYTTKTRVVVRDKEALIQLDAGGINNPSDAWESLSCRDYVPPSVECVYVDMAPQPICNRFEYPY